MKFVHTSDWHAGRVWKRQSRLDELEAALESMVEFVAEHEVDVVLMSGDVFDNRSPSGRAERVVARIFRKLDQAGAKTVAIAGNHDSPTRLDAWKILGELANVHVVPRPKHKDKGGIVEVSSRDGSETAVIAAIPFAGASKLVKSDVMKDDTSSYQKYSDAFQGIVKHLSEAFRDDTINIVMAHTHLESAILARSEREVHTGEQWAAQPQSLPSSAHYVALGHIHRPQEITAPTRACYAGSPMQLDFGEIGETKTFNFVEAYPGRPAQVEKVEYSGARELREFIGTLDQLEARRDEFVDAWMRVTIQLDERDPQLSRKVRDLLPDAVVIKADLPQSETEDDVHAGRAEMSLSELFALYHRLEVGNDIDEKLAKAFRDLHEEVIR